VHVINRTWDAIDGDLDSAERRWEWLPALYGRRAVGRQSRHVQQKQFARRESCRNRRVAGRIENTYRGEIQAGSAKAGRVKPDHQGKYTARPHSDIRLPVRPERVKIAAQRGVIRKIRIGGSAV